MEVLHMNGAGNDFMVIDARGQTPDFQALSQILCRLRRADGFMAVDNSQKADFKLHFYKSDGTRGEMCGNGARCICRYAYDHGIAGEQMTVETDAGLVRGWRLSQDRYRIQLNNPSVLDLHRKGDIAYVELGNPGIPHGVMEYPGDLWADAQALREQMRALRHDPAFPKGANINFYQWIGPAEIRILTFERGVEDFTLACGTGTGATAAVLSRLGKLPEGRLSVHNRGGLLEVSLSQEGGDISALYLEGPTQITETLSI